MHAYVHESMQPNTVLHVIDTARIQHTAADNRCPCVVQAMATHFRSNPREPQRRACTPTSSKIEQQSNTLSGASANFRSSSLANLL